MCAGGHERGHLKFDRMLLKNVKRQHSSILICVDCQWCDACSKVFPKNAFDQEVLHRARSHGRSCVCLTCQNLGYSPLDVQGYLCSGGHTCGHLKFDRQLLKNSKSGNTSTLTCLDCRAPTHKCDACKQRLSKTSFDGNVFKNASILGRVLVCTTCQDKGFTPKDTTLYSCVHGCRLGHGRFPQMDLRNFRRRGGNLLCKAHDSEKNALIEKLRSPDSWKCACKKIKAGLRAQAALYENWGHRGYCPLAPTNFGESRWDGKNKGVTRENLQFLIDSGNKY